MLYDYLFLGSNFSLLFLPIIFYFLNRYSCALQKAQAQNSLIDDKKFHALNSQFLILFKITFILIIVFSVLQIVSILIFNNELIKTNNLIKIDFAFFVFSFLQSLFLITNFFLTFFAFLYFKFKPDYRHHFVQKIFKLFTILIFAGGSTGLMLYYKLSLHLALPELLTYSSKSASLNFLELNLITYGPLLILFFIFSYSYRVFSKKRNIKTSRYYLMAYFITILATAILFFNFSLKYFEIFGVISTKNVLFHYSTFYAGLVLSYLFSLSFYGIIFSTFIYMKQRKFIGSQFAVSYTLKFARLNFYSTLGLVILIVFPWAMLEFYNYF